MSLPNCSSYPLHSSNSITYRVVVLGSAKTGKQTLIRAARTRFAQLEDEINQEEKELSPITPTNPVASSRRSSRRLSAPWLSRRLSQIFSSGSGSPRAEEESWTEMWARQAPAIAKSPSTEKDEEDELTVTIVSSSNQRYRLELRCIHDTGFNFEEQDAVQHADAFLFLVDLSNKFSKTRAQFFYDKVMRITKDHYTRYMVTDPYMPSEEQNQLLLDFERLMSTLKLPMVLVGTKSDVEVESRQIETIDCLEMADSWQRCPYVEVCSINQTVASNRTSVESTFRELLSQILTTKKRKSFSALTQNPLLTSMIGVL